MNIVIEVGQVWQNKHYPLVFMSVQNTIQLDNGIPDVLYACGFEDEDVTAEWINEQYILYRYANGNRVEPVTTNKHPHEWLRGDSAINTIFHKCKKCGDTETRYTGSSRILPEYGCIAVVPYTVNADEESALTQSMTLVEKNNELKIQKAEDKITIVELNQKIVDLQEDHKNDTKQLQQYMDKLAEVEDITLALTKLLGM